MRISRYLNHVFAKSFAILKLEDIKMSANVTKICMSCGRTYNARNSKHPFCSIACKRRYTNRRTFNCADCRQVSCPVRNNYSNTVPAGCLNFAWDASRKLHA